MRVLLVSPYLPRHDIGHGGGIAMTRLVDGLAERCELTVAAFVRAGEEEAVEALRARCAAVHAVPFLSEHETGLSGRLRLVGSRLLAAGASLLSERPYFVEKYRQAAMRACLTELAREPFDLVGFEFLQMAPYAALFREHPGVVQLDTHEIHTIKAFGAMRLARGQRALGEGLRALRWARFEGDVVRSFDRVMCFTAQDRAVLCALSGRMHVDVVPLGLDVTGTPARSVEREEADSLMFVGSFSHAPNVDAARYLLADIFPALRARRPGVRLSVIGGGLPPDLRTLAGRYGDAVRLPGFVPDLGGEFDRHAVFLAPMRYGGGIKTKTLDAMARGMPLVSTAWGADGIPLEDGVHGRIADGREFVEATLALLADPDQRHALGTAAREQMLRTHSVAHAAEAWLAGAEAARRRG